VIVGGGFAGFWAAMAARRVAGAHTDIALISRDPILQIRPRLYEADPQDLGVDLRPLLAATDVRFVQGDAIGLDVDRHVVELVGGELEYARVVVATGSSMRRPPVPGAHEAFSIDTQSDATLFDRRLAEIAQTCANPVIAVIGSGFTGLELVLELRDRIATHGGESQAERLRIVLVDRAPVAARALGPVHGL
jgi:NADH dehydrogenase